MTAIAVLFGLVQAWRLRWVCDDAFISFRYARNLVDGHGLVWNVSEWVEGYTNLLWTLLVAAGMAVGLEPVRLSWVLGLCTWTLTIGLLYWSETVWGQGRLPLATWVFALCPDVETWATGGLETMPLTAALMATVIAVRAGRLWTAAMLGCVDWWLHPDAVLPALVLLGGGVVLEPKWPAIRRRIGPAALLIVCVACTTAWRFFYYGAWLPNTFYAKSAGTAWLSQGLWYLVLFLWRNWSLTIVLTSGLGALAISGFRARRFPAEVVPALAGLSFVLYVVYSGGDFMQARRLVPALPLMLAPAGQAMLTMLPATMSLPVALMAAIGAAVPWPVFGSEARLGGVADEREFYPPQVVEMRRRQAEELAQALDGIREPLLIEGGLCILAFYSGRDEIIEINGLTDAALAREPLSRRSIPGHEKAPSEEYLDRRAVELIVLHAPAPQNVQLVDVVILPRTSLALRVRHYVPALMERLASHGAQLVRSDALLAWAHDTVSRDTCEGARALLERLDVYYFAPTKDFRRGELQQAVHARCSAR